MMDNQHKQIKGYRDLSQEEINLMNKIKMVAEEVGKLVEEVSESEINLYREAKDCGVTYGLKYGSFDEHFGWVELAKTDLRVGFMKLIRVVAKPQSF